MGSVTIVNSYEESENLLGDMHILCPYSKVQGRDGNMLKKEQMQKPPHPPHPTKARSFIAAPLKLKCASESLGDQAERTLGSVGLGWG